MQPACVPILPLSCSVTFLESVIYFSSQTYNFKCLIIMDGCLISAISSPLASLTLTFHAHPSTPCKWQLWNHLCCLSLKSQWPFSLLITPLVLSSTISSSNFLPSPSRPFKNHSHFPYLSTFIEILSSFHFDSMLCLFVSLMSSYFSALDILH